MSNDINIADILREHRFMEKNFYSPLIGDCELKGSKNEEIIIASGDILVTLAYNGKLYDKAGAESMIFPSKEMPDWSKFFKRGDVIFSCSAQMVAIFEGWVDPCYTEFKISFSEHNDGTWNKGEVCRTKDFFLAAERDIKIFISKAEEHYHGKYNPETLQVEPVKLECPFKPFDKVLVRNYDTDEWLPGFFYRFDKDWNYPYHIMNLHHLTDFAYKQCIPYEGSEHLLGTTDPYTEGDSE